MAFVCEIAADSPLKTLAFQTDAFKNCDSSISRQSTLFTDDEAQMSMSRMTTDTSLFSDQLPTTTAPMSLFSQEEEPVESSGETGMPGDSCFEAPELVIAQEKTFDYDKDPCVASTSMPDSHFQLLDAQLASEGSDDHWEWHAGETHSAETSDKLWEWHTGC